MTGIEILKVFTTVLLFLVASYFIFYKSWLKALGNEVAKLVTVKDLTKIQENIKLDFNKQLEDYKNNLDEKLSHKIEPLKAELSKNNITHQIQFSYLHQERSKVVLDLYRKLVELQSAMVNWTSFMHPIIQDAEREAKERVERANVAFNDFRNFYLLNKLFFPKSFCDTFDIILDEYWNKLWDYGFKEGMIKENRSITDDFYRHLIKDMSEISKELKEKIPEKITEIEDKFREMLNVGE
ncbi:hypothetical protein [Chryseobacterium scophthalmum]|uniref:Uncharacterized protein n=1 Tax=Chryseobacterium scophthalmum TaxID=59733 RepID=A0A1N6IWG7_9FLAO|nr:hypothetical protein [Chryseobacterium scophthalmum]SIO36388.1 hypothetical protein SAMN05421769_3849 [Chryseobacterium scophthalmum]